MPRYIKSNQRTGALEYGMRFGCGAIFGAFASIFVLRRHVPDHLLLCVVGSAVFFGLIAALMGDEFYHQFRG